MSNEATKLAQEIKARHCESSFGIGYCRPCAVRLTDCIYLRAADMLLELARLSDVDWLANALRTHDNSAVGYGVLAERILNAATLREENTRLRRKARWRFLVGALITSAIFFAMSYGVAELKNFEIRRVPEIPVKTAVSEREERDYERTLASRTGEIHDVHGFGGADV